MRRLGFDSFDVVGHDRGGRVVHRMALNSPEAIRRLDVMDVIPTGEVWARADDRFALGYWPGPSWPNPIRLVGGAPVQLVEVEQLVPLGLTPTIRFTLGGAGSGVEQDSPHPCDRPWTDGGRAR